MKKIISILLVLVLVCSFAFADETAEEKIKKDFIADIKANEDIAFADSLASFTPVNPKMMGMGGAGLAINSSLDALFTNPSVLGRGKVRIAIPSVTFSINHIYDLMKKDENGNSAIENIEKMSSGDMENSDVDTMMNLISSLIGSGKGKIASFEASTGLIANVFGVAANVSDTIRTFNGTIFDDLKVSTVAGLGFGFGGDEVKFTVGGSFKYNVNIFTRRMGLGDFQAMMNSDSNGNSGSGSDPASSSEENTLSNIPLAVGYGMPLDFAVSLKYYGLSATAVLTDVNLFGLGDYKYGILVPSDEMTSTSATTFVKNLDKESVFKFTPKVDLDLGIGYEGKLSIIGFKAAVDFVDLISLVGELDGGYSAKNVLLNHTKAGAEISLFDMIKVRGGINSGYLTLGGSFNIGIITVDTAYYWEELGSFAGHNGLDCMTIRFNLGWDN